MPSNKLSGLGRGLDSIFIENTAPTEGVTMMRISKIEPRADQPRKKFDREALEALSESIAQHGLIQPVAVREAAGGFFEIIAGERRWRASKMAGLTEIPVVILSADEKKASELALVENIQREDLDPIEEAKAYREIAEKYKYTQEDIARIVGKSRPSVANALRLLDLPESVMTLVADGKLSAGHAKVLLSLPDPSLVEECASIVCERGLSVRECEVLVRKTAKAYAQKKDDDDDTPISEEDKPINYSKVLEGKASAMMGRRVKIVSTGKNKRVELSYENDSDLESILESLCGKGIFEDL